MNANWINIRGWVFHEVERISDVRLTIKQKTLQERHSPQFNINCMDVTNAFPYSENSLASVFQGSFQIGLRGPIEIFLEFTLDNKETITVSIGDALLGRRSPWKDFLIFISSINWIRILKTFRFLIRGDFSGMKAKIAHVRNIKTQYTIKYSDLKSLLPAFQEKPLVPILFNKEIDIIIPVYNAYEFIGPLFNSILKNTPTPYRLIIIDDCSTDERVYPFLEKIAQIHGHTVLLRQDENQGFIRSINRAFQEVKNHFVILNIDMEVPYNWLGRLMQPIMEAHNIATTTPFSNSASICSFPNFCQDNEIFEELPVGVIDKVFATLTGMEPIDIPTGVGFCMGVNLDVAKKIGMFDPIYEEYGAENDMCMRATALSYRNVMVPNLFVYHKHSGSFGTAEKQKLLKRNLKILCERHPTYESLVKEFIDKDPIRPLRELFVVMVSCNCLEKKIRLLIDHDIGGGANQYRNRLIENYIADEEPILLLTFDQDGDSLLKLKFYYREFALNLILKDLGELKDFAKLIRISEIFYNNAVTYPNPISVAELICELKDLSGAHLTVSWHDFYLICPSYNLLNDKGRFCDIPDDLKVCASCLKNNEDKNIQRIDIAHWRKVWGRVIEKSDTLLCFSENSAALVKKAYGALDYKIEIQPHSLDFFPSKVPGLGFSNGLHIGVLGNINYKKGLNIVLDLAAEIKRSKLKTRITVIGNLDAISYPSNITVTGTYNPTDLPDIIDGRKVNLFLFPSVGPETFSYVTEEIMVMKMPIACFNLGAPADTVKKYELGRILGSMKASEILRELYEFYEQLPGLIQKHRKIQQSQNEN